MNREAYAAVRRALGYTQRQLARVLGVHPNTISQRERGLIRITREAWLAITHPKVSGGNENE